MSNKLFTKQTKTYIKNFKFVVAKRADLKKSHYKGKKENL